MTQQEMDEVNTLMREKYTVVKELTNYLHHAKFDRTQLTSVMLKELKDRINEMLKNDF